MKIFVQAVTIASFWIPTVQFQLLVDRERNSLLLPFSAIINYPEIGGKTVSANQRKEFFGGKIL